MLCWHTGHHPWMDWDAPWEEQPKTIDAEKYRPWALANIAAKNPPYQIADEQGSSLQYEQALLQNTVSFLGCKFS